ncbi:tetratricopeptide repeat protein [Bacillus sp. RG28]|uniref:Tetratricopeptide repeat protein n=1 Tax=Gottfriedia endophytica TaxID=2820819 RepID=A0A940NGR7_9BACI|nr:tetratricopeptide repeat protein [Gottfriedia endophytica]MBP0723687.1 tetratricopeptide repeat protein [Gottfriedia endophytica]
MLKPKRSIRHFKETASRQFTDREIPRQSFRKAFNSLRNDQYKVLVYYGVGGVGKSRLLKELQNQTSSLDDSAVKVSIDFRESKHRDPSEALIWLRQQLTKEYNIKFTTFDLAYAVYWSRMKPQLLLKSEGRAIPFLEEGNFVGDLISQLDNIPVVQWIPKTLKLIDGFAQYKEITKWWNRTGKEILSDLKDMHPKDIEDMFLVYWTDDLREWLRTFNRKAVFFFDTYEALWEHDRSKGSFCEKDEWIREFILQFEDVSVLNVICGREKITWENEKPEWGDVVEQHLIGELSPADCISFLDSCNITDKSIQETIIQGSRGLPYYLDLMVDTYQLVSKKGEPTVEDFSSRPNEVLQRFLKYLDRPEKETLKVLSVPRFWSESLFADLVTEFQTFYQPTAFDGFCHFSFIKEIDRSGYWSMHKLMKEGLYEQIITVSPQLLDKVHLFLFNYYTERLITKDTSVERDTAFVEGLYHGQFILDENELINWISRNSILLINEGKWPTLIQEYLRIIEGSLSNKKLCAYLNHQLISLYILKGQYQLAVKCSQNAMKYYQEDLHSITNNTTYKNMADIQKKLGDLYRNTNEYEKAVQAFTDALDYLKKGSGDDDPQIILDIAFVSTHLGKVFKLQSRYDEAIQCYELALEKCNKLVSSEHKSSSLYAVLGEVHEKLGEIKHGEFQEKENNDLSHYFLAIDAYNHALQDKEIENYIPVLAQLGLTYKRLAEAYSLNTHSSEKLQYFHQSITIYNEVIKVVPDYVDGYEKRGHASVDLLDLCIDLEMYKEGMDSFNLAVDSFEFALELSEKQGSSLNRLGSAYRSLGRLHRKQKNYSLAIQDCETALQKSDELFRYSPDYIYAYNSRGKTYKEMGDCYLDMDNRTSAVNSFKKAAACFETTLKKSPNSKTALTYLEKLNKLTQ